jgi:hypothetical protein
MITMTSEGSEKLIIHSDMNLGSHPSGIHSDKLLALGRSSQYNGKRQQEKKVISVYGVHIWDRIYLVFSI